MTCPACGVENPPDSKTCSGCGSGLSSLADAPTMGGFDETVADPGRARKTPGGADLRAPGGDSPSQAATAFAAGAAAAAAPAYGPEGATAARAAIPPRPKSGGAGDPDPGFRDAAAHVDFGPRYRIERMLGEGGMGAVYKAYDVELDRTVALKLIRPGLASAPAATQRFKQELLLASKISHKNVLRIHDLGVAGSLRFISMAYVEGEDLHALLRREGRLPVERALAIARQLCAALEAAHAEGVVHRDLKPQNILLDGNEQVFVSDFGLAKSLETDIGMTNTGEFLGTPRYMAPEQVEGKQVDHRADLYAFGLILYEMVTGDVPFHAETALQLMFKRIREEPVSPRQFNPDLPDYLAKVILKCLERDPEQRYQSAREILGDLEAGRAPATSARVSIAVPGVAFSLRRGWLIAAVVMVALAIGGGAWLWRSRAARQQATQATARPAKYVAVLPFRVIGGDKELAVIADGIQEAIVAKMFGMEQVHVSPASAVEKIAADEPPAEVARELGVGLIVQGTLQGNADRFRAVVTLNDASGKQLWIKEVSGVPGDLLTIEDQLYADLVNAMEVRRSTEEMARTSAHPTEDIDAYAMYLKGRNAMRSQLKVENVRAAISMFEQAVQRDARFALAYTGIADASLRMYLENKDPQWAAKAVAAAEQARSLAENLPEVHFALGSVYSATGKTAEAIAELKRALELAPNSDEGYRRLGDAYRAAGRKDESLAAYAKAVQVNPYFWMNENALGLAYVNFGENEKALESFRRVTQLDPRNAAAYRNLGMAYFRLGKYNESIAETQKSLEIEPHRVAYSNMGTAYFYLKRYADAVTMFEKAVQMNPASDMSMGNLADAYRWSGRQQDAQVTYEKAIALSLKALRVNPRDASTMASLSLYYAKKGDTAQAAQFIRRARTISPNDAELAYIEGVVNTLAGQVSPALADLREAFEKGYPVKEALNDPELGKLNSLPEFLQLTQQFQGKRQ